MDTHGHVAVCLSSKGLSQSILPQLMPRVGQSPGTSSLARRAPCSLSDLFASLGRAAFISAQPI